MIRRRYSVKPDLRNSLFPEFIVLKAEEYKKHRIFVAVKSFLIYLRATINLFENHYTKNES